MIKLRIELAKTWQRVGKDYRIQGKQPLCKEHAESPFGFGRIIAKTRYAVIGPMCAAVICPSPPLRSLVRPPTLSGCWALIACKANIGPRRRCGCISPPPIAKQCGRRRKRGSRGKPKETKKTRRSHVERGSAVIAMGVRSK